MSIETDFITLFEIKPIDIAEYGATYIPNSIEIQGMRFPSVTSEKLVKLICVVFDIYGVMEYESVKLTPELLKAKVLRMLIIARDDAWFRVKGIMED